MWETHGAAGRHGIDHVWVQAGTSDRLGVIGETKSSLLGAFRFLAALTPGIRQQLHALSDLEDSAPTPSGHADIFTNEARDQVKPGKVRVGGTQKVEDELKRGLGLANQNTGLKTQMSHEWIAKAIEKEDLTAEGRKLAALIRSWEIRRLSESSLSPPYTRWLIMITGRQKYLYDISMGHRHEIQNPLIAIPDNLLHR